MFTSLIFNAFIASIYDLCNWVGITAAKNSCLCMQNGNPLVRTCALVFVLPQWHANDNGGATVDFMLLPIPDLLSIMLSSVR